MRILHVVPALGQVYGGTSTAVLELAHALSCSGIEINIATTNANGATQLDVPLTAWVKHDGYRVQYFPYTLGEYKYSRLFSQWLHRHVSQYDLVHLHALFCYPSLPVYWFCYWYRIPYIVTPHGMLEPWAMASKHSKKRVYYNLYEKPGLNRANALHMLATPEAQNTALLHLKTPQVVIPNGVHRNEFESRPEPELFFRNFPALRNKSIILFLGRIDPKKGLNLLAQAFSQIRQQFSDAHIVIAGPDNSGFLSTTMNYFAEVGCLDTVTFTGMLTGDLKMAALAAAQIFVAPSYSEGFSMSVLEGMASELPCVITTGCNFPEAAMANVAHVVGPNAAEIADALARCLADPCEAAEMGQRARQFIFDHYTWDKLAVNMGNVYEAILGNKPIPSLYVFDR